MTRFQLNQAVSAATGENRHFIESRGFSLVDETSAVHEEDLEELIADWERVQAEQAYAGLKYPAAPNVGTLRVRRNKRRARVTVTNRQ